MDTAVQELRNFTMPASYSEVQDLLESFSHPYSKGRYQYLFHLIGIVAFYLMFVLDFGPQFMKHRAPYDLKNIMKYYNYINIAANFTIVTLGLYFTRGMYECWLCQESSAPKWIPFLAGETYLALKIFDLADTVFFILRKKWNQVTPLHVIHHSIMPFTAWLALKYAPLPSAGKVLLLNSFVHTLMYLYYHLASLGKDVWWKKYITVIQLIQFYICLVHAVHMLLIPDCNFPKWLACLQAAESIFFIVTFTNFYIRNYHKIKGN